MEGRGKEEKGEGKEREGNGGRGAVKSVKLRARKVASPPLSQIFSAPQN